MSSEKVNTLRLLGRSVKLGYCVLLIDSALMSEMFMEVRSEPDGTSRSVDVVLKERTEADFGAGRSSLLSPCKKAKHPISCVRCLRRPSRSQGSSNRSRSPGLLELRSDPARKGRGQEGGGGGGDMQASERARKAGGGGGE